MIKFKTAHSLIFMSTFTCSYRYDYSYKLDWKMKILKYSLQILQLLPFLKDTIAAYVQMTSHINICCALPRYTSISIHW